MGVMAIGCCLVFASAVLILDISAIFTSISRQMLFFVVVVAAGTKIYLLIFDTSDHNHAAKIS